jgi:hypothetical protein
MSFDYDRFQIDQLVRPIVNLYQVTPLAIGLSIRDRYALDLSADTERRLDRRLAIALDTLQNR